MLECRIRPLLGTDEAPRTERSQVRSRYSSPALVAIPNNISRFAPSTSLQPANSSRT